MQESKNAFRTELVFGAILVTTLLTLALFVAVGGAGARGDALAAAKPERG